MMQPQPYEPTETDLAEMRMTFAQFDREDAQAEFERMNHKPTNGDDNGYATPTD